MVNLGSGCAKVSLSKRLILLSAVGTLLLGLVTFTATQKSRGGFLVWSDGIAYFLYARSIVIDFDVDLTNEYNEFTKRFPPEIVKSHMQWTRLNPVTGRISNQWPAGSGMVMAPFYAAGYIAERAFSALVGRHPDSYGLIPQYFFCFGSLAYGLLGFWLVVWCCRQVIPTKASYIASIGALFGGPLSFYIFFQPSWSHASSFGLVSILVVLWWQSWHKGLNYNIWLGFLLGVIITVRYQNAIFGILLIALVLRQALQNSKAKAVRQTVVMLVACLIPLSLEVAHYVVQHEFFLRSTRSWQAKGAFLAYERGIQLASPDFFNVLFSCDRGLIYLMPAMGLSFVGLLISARREGWARVFVFTTLAHVYLVGGHYWGPRDHFFGMRFLSECTPFFAMGLAILGRNTNGRIRNLIWTIGLGTLVVFNGSLMLAYNLNKIPRGGCVTYGQMVNGIVEALRVLAGA